MFVKLRKEVEKYFVESNK